MTPLDVIEGRARCTLCAQMLPLSDFYIRASSGRPQSWCKKCLRDNRRESRKANPVAYNAGNRARFARLRHAILKAYGGACMCCGETEPKFLAVDHVRGFRSPEHKGEPRGGDKLYRLIRRQGFPKDRFRLLCHNCNQARGFYGRCPHEDAS